MLGGDVNPYPILLLINYWEICASSVAARLDELIKRGHTQVATFVPWQVAESDISHALIRFLQLAAERHLSVFLILSPEVGVHHLNSGLPKDLIGKKENMAFHCQAEKIAVHLPPSSFALPSYFSAEFNKRYYSYLARMDSLFYDLLKNQPSLMRRVSVTLTGSFWKYYRSPMISAHSPFGGNAGDYSTHASLAYRERTEALFAHREFCDPTPAAANRWKTRGMEETNRRWFYQHAEDVFRSRTTRAIRKKSLQLRVTEMELYTPEADPSMTYSRYLQMVSGNAADFSKLSQLIDQAACRSTAADGIPTLPFLHWSSMGGFRNLSESEKQFLILKSLLLLATRGGGILIEDGDWLGFSAAFRARIESLVRTLTHDGDFQIKNPALYLTSHLWSASGTLWEEACAQIGSQIRMISSVDLILRERAAHLLIVDPSWIMTREVVQKLIAWTRAGRVVALPRSTLYTETARAELEKSVIQTQKIEVTMGMPYSLHALGEGKLIVYDVPVSLSVKRESLSAWQTFIAAVLAIADIQTVCRPSDKRLDVVNFEVQKKTLAAFVLNGSRKTVQADLLFAKEVHVSDLGAVFSPSSSSQSESANTTLESSNRFSLDVPPFGVLPLKVEGMNIAQNTERHLAAQNAAETKESAHNAALSELPGLAMEGNIEELWS